MRACFSVRGSFDSLIFSGKNLFFGACLLFWISLILKVALLFFLVFSYLFSLFLVLNFVLLSFSWLRLLLRFILILLGFAFRLVSRTAPEFIMIDFYSLFTPTCTSSFYPDDHLGRFMGFSRFVELKSARSVERLRKIKRIL